MEAHVSFPRLATERCIRNASPFATCDACCTACPRDALSITSGTPNLNEEACDGCGLCHSVCPENAVDLPLHSALRESGKNGLTAFIACTRGAREQEGSVPCIHALGVQDLKAFARQGVNRILANNSGCHACPASASISLDRKLSDFNVIQRSNGMPSIHLEYLPVEVWRKTLFTFRKTPKMPDPGRRRFLGLPTAEPRPSQPPTQHTKRPHVNREERIYATVPQIDITRCNGCDVCVQMCPHDVLKLICFPDNIQYSIDLDLCTGCGLCHDVCDRDAVILHRMTTQKQWVVPLQEGCCSDCGASFHIPCSNKEHADRCRVCINKNNHLFQVFK